MTLLEALVALVVLGLTATGFLESFRAASRAERDAAEWARAAAAADNALESAALGAAPPTDSVFRPVVARRAWAGAPGVDELAATVTLRGGARFTLRRLVRREGGPSAVVIPPGGFTLLEVLIALVVTALVVALAYGALRSGLDVDDRLAARRRADAEQLAFRTLVGDALRHVERGVAEDDSVFVLRGDTLRVVTRGVVPPLGTGGRWRVRVAPVGDAVEARAEPEDGAGARLVVRVADARGLDVAVLAYAGAGWARAWERAAAPPAAVALRLRDARGAEVGPALVARTRPEGEAEEAP